MTGLSLLASAAYVGLGGFKWHHSNILHQQDNYNVGKIPSPFHEWHDGAPFCKHNTQQNPTKFALFKG